MPGSSRMYPETDLYPIILEEEFLKKIKENLPERFDKKIDRISKEYGIEKDLVRNLMKDAEATQGDNLLFNIRMCRTLDAFKKMETNLLI